MGDAAADRLCQYCTRAAYSKPDFHEDDDGRRVRYLAADLRAIVWRDSEVRDVVLEAGESRVAWDALLGELGRERGLALLDLVSAMSLEARRKRRLPVTHPPTG